jgi:hypothetical protein
MNQVIAGMLETDPRPAIVVVQQDGLPAVKGNGGLRIAVPANQRPLNGRMELGRALARFYLERSKGAGLPAPWKITVEDWVVRKLLGSGSVPPFEDGTLTNDGVLDDPSVRLSLLENLGFANLCALAAAGSINAAALREALGRQRALLDSPS